MFETKLDQMGRSQEACPEWIHFHLRDCPCSQHDCQLSSPRGIQPCISCRPKLMSSQRLNRRVRNEVHGFSNHDVNVKKLSLASSSCVSPPMCLFPIGGRGDTNHFKVVMASWSQGFSERPLVENPNVLALRKTIFFSAAAAAEPTNTAAADPNCVFRPGSTTSKVNLMYEHSCRCSCL